MIANIKHLTHAELAEYAETLVNWLIPLRSLRTLRATFHTCYHFAVNRERIWFYWFTTDYV